MPRLSLYRPEKGQDYKFIDKAISEMFQVGGTDVYYHKYLGPKNPLEGESTPTNPEYAEQKVTNVQDLLFLENRDRQYDSTIYTTRGIYNVQDLDFNLSQFGLFIDNDTLFMTVHINDIVALIGRKPVSGDVVELPHLRDENPVNLSDVALPRFFEITDIGRAAEGFSRTWYPHLYRLKLHKITGGQQFADILNKQALDVNGDPSSQTLAELLTTQDKYLQVNDAILQQADADAPKSGYETRQFYTLEVDERGQTILRTADETDITADTTHFDSSDVDAPPTRTGYTGYLLGDGVPDNGASFGSGISFPAGAVDGDFYLRTDYFPNRLFRYDGRRWIKYEDNVRMTMTNQDPTKPISTTNPDRQTQKTGFINNTNYTFTKQIAAGFSHNPTPIPGKPAGYILKDTDEVYTKIKYADIAGGLYVVLKQDVIEINFALADNPTLFENVSTYLKLNLPTGVPYDGVWAITLYAKREEQRQSLSKALKPKADF